MSTLLWKFFFENDIDNFRQVLARATYNATAQNTRAGGKGQSLGSAGSPSAALATSPTLTSKSPKQPSWNASRVSFLNNLPRALANVTLCRADVNWRDQHGVTLLHHISSSTNEKASEFALALLQLPVLDLYVQDEESGWTALHRALYFGNVTIARALMDQDMLDAAQHSSVSASHTIGGLIKIKDREGNSPFDVYGATITSRNIRHDSVIPLLGGNQSDEDNEIAQGVTGDVVENDGIRRMVAPRVQIDGDEMFAFGSNKNFTLGFGDEDDRQFPERVYLKRPDLLLRRFYNALQTQGHLSTTPANHNTTELPRSPLSTSHLPIAARYRPINFQDVQLSKLHSAILTNDPEANLYICGFGSGGRLGTGDETTRFGFVNVHGGGLLGKKVVHLALGQNHTVAISSEGETYTWGSNAYGQLGYAINAKGVKNEEPLQLLPRQIFGSLKRELVVGAAASRIHTVVHTVSSLYTFGKNEGQLGLVDSDARSLVVQNTPRKVAASLFSSAITSVSAIEKATICLLENHDVWVFSNYGYTKMSFPLEGFSNYFLKSIWGPRSSSTENEIRKIVSGGDTICAMSSMGDVFTVQVTQKVESTVATASTTNPSKIRGALSMPQRVWSLKKAHMAVRDVDVSQDGSIIICTESGSVWRRIKRAKIKDASAAGIVEHKAKDYKFSRVPGLTRIAAVRSSAFGAYAAVRRDFDVLKSQLEVESKTLWQDMYPLLPFHGFAEEDSDTENPTPRFWTSSQNNDVAAIRRAVLISRDLEEQVADFLADSTEMSMQHIRIGTTLSEVHIPIHEFLLEARSEVMREALVAFRRDYFFKIPEVMTIEYDVEGKILILFQGVDFITVLNLVLYLYTDSVVDVWNHTRHAPSLAFRYRQIRTEVMKTASHLEMHKLEQAVRMMQEPPKTLDQDLRGAILQPGFFDSGDVQVELDGDSMRVHSAMVVQRCPFFEGLFEGRSAGLWLSSRRENLEENEEAVKVDLKHVEPHVFEYVLQHIYADTDEEMFDAVVASDLDSYLDMILEVLSVANELMLDRLAQCCQKLLGAYVNTRNVCQLLNAVAPCSVTQFKDAALEYICLNLEGLLENRLLGELDEDLMLELDEIVRQNQLTSLPIAKSGRAEAELIEKYPQLLDHIEQAKRTKIDSVALQTHLHEREAKSLGGSKAKAAFLEDFDQSHVAQNSKSDSRHSQASHSKSPALKPKRSAADLMFDMDEDSPPGGQVQDQETPSRRHRDQPESSAPLFLSSLSAEANSQHVEDNATDLEVPEVTFASMTPSSYRAQEVVNSQSPVPVDGKKPWGPPTVPTSSLGMKEIMAQDSSHSHADFPPGLSLHPRDGEISPAALPARMSQRERKKQQHQQTNTPKALPVQVRQPDTNPESEMKPTSPWQTASRGPTISLKDVIGSGTVNSPTQISNVARTPSPLTLRQTVSGKVPSARRVVTGPAQTPLPAQKRSVSTPDASHAASPTPPQPSRSSSSQAPIQSIRHIAPTVEPSLQLSMADILSQQQTEKQIIKEAAAKRSLQEIQEEQAFQEWWDEESRRVRAEEEEAASQPAARGGRGARGKMRGGSRGRGRGRRRGGGGDAGEGSSGGGRDAKTVVHSGQRGRGK